MSRVLWCSIKCASHLRTLDLRYTAIDADFAAFTKLESLEARDRAAVAISSGCLSSLRGILDRKYSFASAGRFVRALVAERPRTEHVHAHPALCEFHRPRSRERPQRRLASRIDTQPWHTLELAIDPFIMIDPPSLIRGSAF